MPRSAAHRFGALLQIAPLHFFIGLCVLRLQAEDGEINSPLQTQDGDVKSPLQTSPAFF
jgi:hypothetical protein